MYLNVKNPIIAYDKAIAGPRKLVLSSSSQLDLIEQVPAKVFPIFFALIKYVNPAIERTIAIIWKVFFGILSCFKAFLILITKYKLKETL